jgi:hypothetical protein
MKKYPTQKWNGFEYTTDVNQCDKCAAELYELFGGSAAPGVEIGTITSRAGRDIATEVNNVTLSEQAGKVNQAFHQFVKVGDRVFDVLTGPSGMKLADYKKLFYDGIFDPSDALGYDITYTKP